MHVLTGILCLHFAFETRFLSLDEFDFKYDRKLSEKQSFR